MFPDLPTVKVPNNPLFGTPLTTSTSLIFNVSRGIVLKSVPAGSITKSPAPVKVWLRITGLLDLTI